MKRIEVIQEVVGSEWGRKGLIVSNIGYASRELYSVSDRSNNFYMLGSMGLASSIGIGLSLAHSRRHVIVLDGDGSVLMNLGTLATIGNSAPSNFHLVIIDNHVHGSTGNQDSHTAMRTSLAKMSVTAGIQEVTEVKTQATLKRLLSGRHLPTAVIVLCEPFNADVPIIPLSPTSIKKRFARFINSRPNSNSGEARDALC